MPILSSSLRSTRSSVLAVPVTGSSTSANLVFPSCRPGRRRRVPQIQIGHTFKVARLVALEATHRKVKAYVRIQHPFYNCKESGQHDEKAEVKPEGVVGTWWHETLRALGAIQE